MGITDIKTTNYEWLRDEAVAFLSKLWDFIDPDYHVALTGSVLYSGASTKDLDVIVYPHTSPSDEHPNFNLEGIRSRLRAFGMTQRPKVEIEKMHPASCMEVTGSWRHRLVEIWEWQGKRVDIFYFSGDYKWSGSATDVFLV